MALLTSLPDATQRLDLLDETKRDLNAGKIVFSRFELLRELGSGGMAVVWLARDLDVEGRVALKFLPGLVRDPVAERDLREEVRNARDLVHENIVCVRTLHKNETSIAVEMEFVDGLNLNALIANHPHRFLDLDEAKPIVRGLCLAIEHAWAVPRRLVHGDIKPHNLLVNAAREVKVVDFGIAHTVSETITRLTRKAGRIHEGIVGTLPYMSPQQLAGEVHHSNDIYGIGATVYHMLTGVPPFRATDPVVLMKQIENDVPVSMSDRRKQFAAENQRSIKGTQRIPREWEETVAACLSKNPAKRPRTAREVAVRLGLLEQPVPPRSRLRPVLIPAVTFGTVAAAWLWLNGIPGLAPATATGGPGEEAVREVPTAVSPSRAQAEQTIAAATLPPVARSSLHLATRTPNSVTVTRAGDGLLIKHGPINPGETQGLPLDATLLLEADEPAALHLEIDGAPHALPATTSNRWYVTVPSDPAKPPTLIEAPPPPPPFESEIGPLVAAGRINRMESDWLRAALGGAKGSRELALARDLVSSGGSGLTIPQWRASTALKFTPGAAALRSTDAALAVHAIDLALGADGIEMRLLRIEPGRFSRGAPATEKGRRPSDQPWAPAQVLRPFFMGVFEVTQAQYEAVMGRSPSYWRGNPSWPVDQVTWRDLTGPNGFLSRIDQELARQLESGLVADLPTEEEWEYACRAGLETPFNNGASVAQDESGPRLDQIAHYDSSDRHPRPVGSFAPNAWGLFDMHGNVQEWTRGGWARGGSWQSKMAGCRAASRVQMNRDASGSNQTGFRLVLRFRDVR